MNLTPLKCYHAEGPLVKGMIYGQVGVTRSGRVILDTFVQVFPPEWFDTVKEPSPDDNWCQPGRKVVYRGYPNGNSPYAAPGLPDLPFGSVWTIESVDETHRPGWYMIVLREQPPADESGSRWEYASCWFEPIDD